MDIPFTHIQTHEELVNFHVPHDPSCHENPPSNIPYDNMKHRRKNKYLATYQEGVNKLLILNFDLMNILIIIQVLFM